MAATIPNDKKNFPSITGRRIFHLVGKEIIRFSLCLLACGGLLATNLPLPKAITAHGWLLFEESKMSKSRGNIVRTETILDAFGTLKPKPEDQPGAVLSDEFWKHEQDLFASDVLRYFLLREIPFGQDGSFSFDALVQRYNSDLANGYGNLVSRTLTLIAKTSSGIVEDCLEAKSLVFYMPELQGDSQSSCERRVAVGLRGPASRLADELRSPSPLGRRSNEAHSQRR